MAISFILQLTHLTIACYHAVTGHVSGHLKPLPAISAEDVEFIDEMIEQKYVPYQNMPDAPGKPVEEIKALGKQYFPFTPFSFQLAMCIYDWTSASFARMVFLKVFEYTGIAPAPFPLDKKSLAQEIWESNYSTYTPQNVDYMRSFLMEPAQKLEEVSSQLIKVVDKLHKFSNVQNRLLAAAMESLPRTSVISKPQLFSGQVDVSQFGLERFGAEFLECPLNNGPVGDELVVPFADVLASFVAVGKTITTKMVWSFADSLDDAIHYSNGILLTANPPNDHPVWQKPSYITPISNDPKKIEYIFAPGTQFKVQSIERATLMGKEVVLISLEPQFDQAADESSQKPKRGEIPLQMLSRGSEWAGMNDIARLVEAYTPSGKLPHSHGATGGRRCACSHN